MIAFMRRPKMTKFNMLLFREILTVDKKIQTKCQIERKQAWCEREKKEVEKKGPRNENVDNHFDQMKLIQNDIILS